MVREGQEGLLIPPQYASALVEALRNLMSDKDNRLALAPRGRQQVEFWYERKLVLGQLGDLCRELFAD